MEFKSNMHRGVHEMVGAWLAEMIRKEEAIAVPDRPQFIASLGSAVASISIEPGPDDTEALIAIHCAAAEVERPDASLFLSLLNVNRTATFGAIGYDPEAKVVLVRATLLGSTCDPKEFFTVLQSVVGLADDLDDQIVKAFGGKTGIAYFRSRMSGAK